ncbi:NAD-dependent epimerase/dehydratase family protein [Spirosoma aureum]|nr:NAD-dependent epimerase/dehydratase family protein [Spirosoma aureum]
MENKQTVLVTGGSGFIASYCIMALLREGYKVKATLRSLKKS